MYCAPGYRGATCRSDLANGRESTAAGGDGRRRGYGTVCLRLWHEARGARPGSSTRRTSSYTRTEPIPQAARASRRSAAPKADSTARSPQWWRVTGERWRSACIPARAAISAPQMSTPACCEVARWSPTRASTPMRCPRHLLRRTHVHPTAAELRRLTSLLPPALSPPSSDRKLLLPHQAASSHQHSLQQTRFHLLRLRSTRFRPRLAQDLILQTRPRSRERWTVLHQNRTPGPKRRPRWAVGHSNFDRRPER